MKQLTIATINRIQEYTGINLNGISQMTLPQLHAEIEHVNKLINNNTPAPDDDPTVDMMEEAFEWLCEYAQSLEEMRRHEDEQAAAELRAERGYEAMLDYRASFDDPRGW